MTKEFSPQRLDVKAFAQAGGRLSGHDSLLKYERLAQEAKGLHPDLQVDWSAEGQWRMASDGIGQAWLGIKVRASLPMECQRCLGPVDMPLSVEREFRFVADEATADALDGQSAQDLLALSREFNLHTLMEDELLMALPVVPKHDECPSAVPLVCQDDDFERANADKPNPFAALASLRKVGKGDA
ncbi:YceD family protein [Verminephrobacter eiseniae]|uniref:YceD family protein n=1 Tax=Verminephrobacter eiseniae TaxID=364317 RepID=UPI0010DC7125|nr:YceD family protein [Verminephrobacter eiseniae]KAB7619395.1 DUF177 domain-containing protein [Verminephrobacter sp. Larva24]MCW5231163.1 DUF177 domain-containing protein [Verminephrobacter eiseniae]MCW5292895.1 DUF177 domain-containing protein [Verminephrobacter eiseniae]MCW8185984.1 DUF177 domain-containing protein [Verminephrobacter eiseniae]MCW8224469.1 DUF177 domain-containing protein [Verminephrobacter eiseniae]